MLDVTTNGVSIGSEKFPVAEVGATVPCLNRIARVGHYEFTWNPVETWPGKRFSHGELSVDVKAYSLVQPPDWMVIDLVAKSNVTFYAVKGDVPGGITDLRYKTSKLLMRKIPAKNCTWRMGSPAAETGHADDETCRYVTLDADYYIGVYELTQAQHSNAFVSAGISYYSGSKQDLSSYRGANAAPDLSNEKLTLNLGNAAGKADAVVPLDGTVNPAGAINMGDYSKGAVTFGGKGTLVLDGADVDLKMTFTQSASLTWNGPGTLVLTGQSTSRGTLAVAGGRVVMEFADWPGTVVVEEGAELVVNESCASRHGVYTGPCVLGANYAPGFLMILQ